jgi:hypothetical protein
VERAHVRPRHHADVTGFELFGYVSFVAAEGPDEEPGDFFASADFTDETAERNPDWKLDLCEEVVGGWRGEDAHVAAMTLVWGPPPHRRRRGGHRGARRAGGGPVAPSRRAASPSSPRTPTAATTSTSSSSIASGTRLASESLYDEMTDPGGCRAAAPPRSRVDSGAHDGAADLRLGDVARVVAGDHVAVPVVDERRLDLRADLGGERAAGVEPAAGGGSIGEGTSPWRTIRLRARFSRGSGIGIAESSAPVYGWIGLEYSASAGETSRSCRGT